MSPRSCVKSLRCSFPLVLVGTPVSSDTYLSGDTMTFMTSRSRPLFSSVLGTFYISS